MACLGAARLLSTPTRRPSPSELSPCLSGACFPSRSPLPCRPLPAPSFPPLSAAVQHTRLSSFVLISFFFLSSECIRGFEGHRREDHVSRRAQLHCERGCDVEAGLVHDVKKTKRESSPALLFCSFSAGRALYLNSASSLVVDFTDAVPVGSSSITVIVANYSKVVGRFSSLNITVSVPVARDGAAYQQCSTYGEPQPFYGSSSLSVTVAVSGCATNATSDSVSTAAIAGIAVGAVVAG